MSPSEHPSFRRVAVLIVDDDEALCEMFGEGLGAHGYAVQVATSGEAAIEKLETTDVDVVVTDLNMAGMNGLALCGWIVGNRADVPVLVITAFGDFESAVAAMRAGAYDFLSKPVKVDVLAMAIARAAAHRALRTEVRRLQAQVGEAASWEGIVGESAAMRSVFAVLARAADADTTILLTGESGTGKERVARAVHHRSPRREGPFVAVSCAALLPSAFTGDELVARARSGTLFLDEIGETPLELQAKFLPLLEERGPGAAIHAGDLRIIASTSRDLEAAVDEHRFREDLHARINVVAVELPPLRARQADILPLAQHFLRHFATRLGRPVTGLSAAAAEKLTTYPWPGNVRELRNAIERSVTLARFDLLGTEDLPEKVRDYRASSHVVVAADDPTELVTLEEVERRYVHRVLGAVAGNKAAAARVLGIERKTLYRKFEQWQRDGAPKSKG